MPTVKKATKKSTSKKAPVKKTTTKKVTVKKEEGEKKSRISANGLNGSHIRVLQTLKGGASMSRAELAEATGINKGWSRILGTTEGGHEDALEPRGFVKSSVPPEGERGMRYTITASGKKSLEKAEKELAKAGKS